jgi:hypothetical protein
MIELAPLLVLTAIGVSAATAKPQFHLVYEGQEGGYALVRTPQLLVTQAGTLLAFAQGRSGSHDQSDTPHEAFF